MPAIGPLETSEQQLEQILHAALGRQLRVMVLLGCVLTVGGFVLGHFVAAVQARSVSERLETRISDLQRQVTHLDARCDRQETETQRTLSALADVQRMRQAEARQDREALAALIDDVRRRAGESLKQVEPYVSRRLYLPPQQVKQLVNRFVDEQVRQMSQLLEIHDRRVTPAAGIADRRAASPPAQPRTVPGGQAAVPMAEAPVNATVPGTQSVTVSPTITEEAPAPASAAPSYVSPPPRRGYLYFSPSQPRRLDPDRISESDAIPLPPR